MAVTVQVPAAAKPIEYAKPWQAGELHEIGTIHLPRHGRQVLPTLLLPASFRQLMALGNHARKTLSVLMSTE